MSLLEVTHLSKSFSGLRAVDDVDFQVEAGEIVGLIGPNGAGKTTLFNLVAGRIPVDTGRVVFDGEDITGWTPHAIARRGIGRTFQLMRPFASMTVRDNVTVAAASSSPRLETARELADAVLDRVALAGMADEFAGALPTAARKRLELARALALDPQLLLLDEVLSGLTPAEREPLLELLVEIADEGRALLLVEHVMAAVMRLSQRILVLHHGQLLAAGTPDEVTSDPDVIEAYLGEEEQLAGS
ncbi:ABC transporter ATP-binding protein [Salsipaludibacter albus]|uniref:ABC transporter ATP-binding protein n=1 Tax=Salsipaludibacter albus TaxID=2849650 RepID=UPI001EE3E207|nr:ABC transporter ATP-binding protein [Salsipaludibacter albus]MBY5162120.1 ABC transporter ATP-binding protein [Salsipaludibacter albus]